MLSAEIARSDHHDLVAVFDAEDLYQSLSDLAPQAVWNDSWESLLHGTVADAVIVARSGADDARADRLRCVLVVHGKADTRLAFACGQQIYDMAQEPKELVLYEGAEHRLEECRDDLEELLGRWIPETLAADIGSGLASTQQ